MFFKRADEIRSASVMFRIVITPQTSPENLVLERRSDLPVMMYLDDAQIEVTKTGTETTFGSVCFDSSLNNKRESASTPFCYFCY